MEDKSQTKRNPYSSAVSARRDSIKFFPLRDRWKQHSKSSGDHVLKMLSKVPATLAIDSAA